MGQRTTGAVPSLVGPGASSLLPQWSVHATLLEPPLGASPGQGRGLAGAGPAVLGVGGSHCCMHGERRDDQAVCARWHQRPVARGGQCALT